MHLWDVTGLDSLRLEVQGREVGEVRHMLTPRYSADIAWLAVNLTEGGGEVLVPGSSVEIRNSRITWRGPRRQIERAPHADLHAFSDAIRDAERYYGVPAATRDYDLVEWLVDQPAGAAPAVQVTELAAEAGADTDTYADAEAAAPPLPPPPSAPAAPPPPPPPAVTRDAPARAPTAPPATEAAVPAAPPASPRMLAARLPETATVGEPFAVQVRIARTPMSSERRGALKPFDVPPEGATVRVTAHAPGLRELAGRLTHDLKVPAAGDSEPVLFEFVATTPQRYPLSLTAYRDGTYLGELPLDITVVVGAAGGESVEHTAGISAQRTDGDVTLTIRFDPIAGRYRFELYGDGYVSAEMLGDAVSGDPGQAVEQLVTSLDALAAARSGYSSGQTRDYLENQGAALWGQLVPPDLRDRFWELRSQIRQMTIITDRDVVPWELLYPLDRGQRAAGFLIEQFPVTRWVFDQRRSLRLPLSTVRYVVPDGSPPEASAEVEAIRTALAAAHGGDDVIRTLDPLTAAITAGDFDVLHFACHNRFTAQTGSSIALAEGAFTPVHLQKARIARPLAERGPLVFVNACRSSGAAWAFTRLDSWAAAFLAAGAGAFIGSSWSVRDSSARTFAETVYQRLRAGDPLGRAVDAGRARISAEAGDSTWLAYTVYGDPRALAA